VADLDRTGPAALAADGDLPLPQVDIAVLRVAGVAADPGKLRQADPFSRLEHGDHRRVRAILKPQPARPLQPFQLLAREDRDGLVGDAGGLSPAIGSPISSSSASHLKNCRSARNWLLAYAQL
jgi:hypothetical protein